ncbi:hypothetical protein E2C01_099188 [Portunus trituberculatus]|uniref:Uncharacterized protein n=1 Tax=Portunus trituberculatus TaxID=210409 RepID=A0A5B7KAC0_PORTR|nr:hypothetical protein [Portunus trituberculatus]
MKCCRKSMGNGKMMVEFFSAEMVLSVCGREGGRQGGREKEREREREREREGRCV